MTLPSNATTTDILDYLKNMTGINNKSDLINIFNTCESNSDYIKNKLVEVIGSPVLSADSYNKIISNIQNYKDILIQNLTNKNIYKDNSESILSLINSVNDIPTFECNLNDIDGVADKFTLIYCDDNGRSMMGTTNTKVFEYRMKFSGTIRIFTNFWRDSGSSGQTCYGSIRVNNTEIKSASADSSNSIPTHVDTTVKVGDLIQIYLYTTGIATSGFATYIKIMSSSIPFGDVIL